MGMALSAIGGLTSLVCWILTLVRMFQDKTNGGVGKGIVGIICGLYALVWGISNGPRNITIAWVVGIVLSLVGNFVFGAGVK